jgi:hypothetical protein
MSDVMLDLLESCFEDQEDRPADASALAEKLGTLLKPLSSGDKVVLNQKSSVGRQRVVKEEKDVRSRWDLATFKAWAKHIGEVVYERRKRELPDEREDIREWVTGVSTEIDPSHREAFVLVGTDIRYTVIIKTCEIFGMNDLEIDKGRRYGTLPEWRDWDWSGDHPRRREAGENPPSGKGKQEVRTREVQSSGRVKNKVSKTSGKAAQGSSISGDSSLLLAHQPLKEIVNSIGMRLKLIPAGEILTGPFEEEDDDEQSSHPSTIRRPYWLGVYPVTQDEYKQIMG